MRLRRLRIDRLPGIDPGFTFVAPSDGLNIVTGPNAIGKSSLARALGYLLDSRKGDPAGLQLEAEFARGATRWTARRFGGAVDWRRNGEAAPAPNLPGASQFGQYLLSVERLLGATDSDRDLARTLWRTLRGGYDLGEARLGIGKLHGNREAKQLRGSESELRKIERDQAALRRDEARLPELEDRIQASERARARCATLQEGLELHAAIRKQRSCQAALDAFPDGMDRLLGNEHERLSKLRQDREKAEDKRRDAQRDLDAAIERLANSGFEDRRPTDEAVANAEAALRRVERKADKRDSAAERLLDAEAALKTAVSTLGGGAVPPRNGKHSDAERERDDGGGGENHGADREGKHPDAAPERGDGGDGENHGADREGKHSDAAPERGMPTVAGDMPRLDAGSLARARKIAEPLADAKVRERELTQQLELAGEPVGDSEIDRYRDGALALREWLAATLAAETARPLKRSQAILLVAGVAVLVAALLAMVALGTGIIALLGTAGVGATLCLIAWRLSGGWRRELDHNVAAARSRFDPTGLDAPPAWDRATVQQFLRDEIDPELDRLRLRQERAAGAVKLRADWQKVREQIEELEIERRDFAAECGLDPELTGAPLLRFVMAVQDWNRARIDHAQRLAAVEKLDEEIAAAATQVHDFVHEWRELSAREPFDDSMSEANAPPSENLISEAGFQALRSAWDALLERLREAHEASVAIKDARQALRAHGERIAELEDDIARVFHDAGVAQITQDKARDSREREEIEMLQVAERELAERLRQLDAWTNARDARIKAGGEVDRLRTLLNGEPAPADAVDGLTSGPAPVARALKLVELVEQGAIESIECELGEARQAADRHDDLIREKQDINTRLDQARAGQQLEQAAAAHGKAAAALEDKRDEALLAQVTNLLLDDVEGAFRSEHEPRLLTRARERFEQATAREFTLDILDGARFIAMDVRQGEKRELAELSSGTRMQLLLALRLAATEETESGGEALPLFLDEALTASDEARFAEIARTLSRLADEQGRQIFYLTARRQDAALWENAIGTAPAVIDLAAVRFGARDDVSLPPVALPPPRVPSPAGMDDTAWAAAIGVSPVDPRRDPGGIHVFHLLRDELELAHTLLDAWRIGALGPLEALLASSAAANAVPDGAARQRLRNRCRAAREWTLAWRVGRGKPVDRIVLETIVREQTARQQPPAVTDIFLDRVADLANQVAGDGRELVNRLKAGAVAFFRSSNVARLEDSLVEHGYIDRAEILDRDGRCLQTLQRAATPGADPADLNRAIDWLEAAAATK